MPERDERFDTFRLVCRLKEKNLKRTSIYLVGCMIAATLLFLSLAPGTSYSKELAAEVNERTLVLMLTAPGRPVILAPAFDGQVLTTEDERTGAGLSFTLIMSSGTEGSVQIELSSIEPSGKFARLEPIKVSIGAASTVVPRSPYKIEVDWIARSAIRALITRISHPEPSLRKAAYSPEPFLAQCCVTCDGVRTCANCAVVCGPNCCCTSGPGCCGFCQ